MPIVALRGHFHNPDNSEQELYYEGAGSNKSDRVPKVPRVIVGLNSQYKELLEQHDDLLGPLGVIAGQPRRNFAHGAPYTPDGELLQPDQFVGGEAVFLITVAFQSQEGYSNESQSFPPGSEGQCGEGKAGIKGITQIYENAVENFSYSIDMNEYPLQDPAYRARYSRLLILVYPPAERTASTGLIDTGHTCTTDGTEETEHVVITGTRTYQLDNGSVSNWNAKISEIGEIFGDSAVILTVSDEGINKEEVMQHIVEFFEGSVDEV